MNRKENFLASKLMLEFITHYIDLTQHQLLKIKEEMDETCHTIMGQVEKISNVADTKKEEAETIIVKNQKVRNKKEEKSNSEENITLKNSFQRSGGLYTKSMEAVSSLDENLQAIVMGVIGIISMDDVIKQRMQHVIYSVNMLKEVIHEIVPLVQKGLTRGEVSTVRNRLLSRTYRVYTMESEKKLFHSYFGRPIQKKSA